MIAQTAGSRHLKLVTTIVCALLSWLVVPASVVAQTLVEPQPDETQFTPQPDGQRLQGEALFDFIRHQFAELDNPSYRARARARWSLEQYPVETIEQIRLTVRDVSVNAALQQIELLDYFATRPDVVISTSAFEALKSLASKEGTSIASMAKRCMMAIEDAKEQQATEILRAAGASIGNLPIPINGYQTMAIGPEPANEIRESGFVR